MNTDSVGHGGSNDQHDGPSVAQALDQVQVDDKFLVQKTKSYVIQSKSSGYNDASAGGGDPNKKHLETTESAADSHHQHDQYSNSVKNSRLHQNNLTVTTNSAVMKALGGADGHQK